MAGRPRKPAPPITKAERKAKKDEALIPSIVKNGTLAWEAAKLMRAGKSSSEVAQRLNVTENALAQVMKDAMLQIQDHVANVLTNWTTISISREEEILAGLWPLMFDDSGSPNPTVIGLVQDVIMAEQKILAFSMAKMSKDGGSSIVQNVTIVNNHDPTGLYMEAQRAMNMNMRTEEGESKDPLVASLDDPIPGGIVYMPKAKHGD